MTNDATIKERVDAAARPSPDTPMTTASCA